MDAEVGVVPDQHPLEGAIGAEPEAAAAAFVAGVRGGGREALADSAWERARTAAGETPAAGAEETAVPALSGKGDPDRDAVAGRRVRGNRRHAAVGGAGIAGGVDGRRLDGRVGEVDGGEALAGAGRFDRAVDRRRRPLRGRGSGDCQGERGGDQGVLHGSVRGQRVSSAAH